MAKNYTISEGDTLRSIAARNLGDPNLWPKIALINNLDFPYIGVAGETYAGNVVLPGSTIIIPFKDPSSDDEAYFAERNKTQNDGQGNPVKVDYYKLFLKTDVAVSGGDIVWAYGVEGIDLLTVSGTSNMVQAILNRFITSLGSLLYFPQYGSALKRYVGGVLDRGTIEMAKGEAYRTVMQDPRIRSVLSLQVAVGASLDSLNITMSLELITGTALDVSVPLSPSTFTNLISLNYPSWDAIQGIDSLTNMDSLKH